MNKKRKVARPHPYETTVDGKKVTIKTDVAERYPLLFADLPPEADYKIFAGFPKYKAGMWLMWLGVSFAFSTS